MSTCTWGPGLDGWLDWALELWTMWAGLSSLLATEYFGIRRQYTRCTTANTTTATTTTEHTMMPAMVTPLSMTEGSTWRKRGGGSRAASSAEEGRETEVRARYILL